MPSELILGTCVSRGMVVVRRSRRVTVAALLLLLLALFIVGFPAPLRSSTVRLSVPGTTNKRSPDIVLTQHMYIGGYEDPHPELCRVRGRWLRLVVLVASAPGHARARTAVRRTWGRAAARADVALAFVLGAAPAALRHVLRVEAAVYADLIIGRWIDSYSNLTLKTLAMLEWVAAYCPNAQRLLKADDDIFINIPRLLRVIGDKARVNATRTIWGYIIHKAPVIRSTKSKFFVPLVQYPAQSYPDYANGPAYVMTTDCIADLLAAAPVEPYIGIEDAFVTGVLASKVNISRQHVADFVQEGVRARPCEIQKALAIHKVQYQQQFVFWGKLMNAKCSK